MNREQDSEAKTTVVIRRRPTTQYSAAKRTQLMEAAKRRWSEGASIRAVVDELGVSAHTLSYWRAVEGIGVETWRS
jgi:hypothetical protein